MSCFAWGLPHLRVDVLHSMKESILPLDSIPPVVHFFSLSGSQVAGALVKTLLELSLAMQVPIINGLVFSRGSAGDLNALSCKLATSAMDMAAMSEGGKESYTGRCLCPVFLLLCVEEIRRSLCVSVYVSSFEVLLFCPLGPSELIVRSGPLV